MNIEQSKKDRIKNWTRKHQDAIIVTSIYGVAIGAFVGIVVLAAKQENVAIKDYNTYMASMAKWINEETAAGKSIYQLIDGAFLVIDSDATREIVLK